MNWRKCSTHRSGTALERAATPHNDDHDYLPSLPEGGFSYFAAGSPVTSPAERNREHEGLMILKFSRPDGRRRRPLL